MQTDSQSPEFARLSSPERKIDPQRIKLARRLCHYSMDELCRRMGEDAVSKMAISKIERGIFTPSPNVLKAMAKACGVPLGYFYRQDIHIGQMDFRFSESISKRKSEEIRAQVTAAIIDYAITNSCVPSTNEFFAPMARTTLRTYADVEVAASRLRRKWCIGLQPIFSVYELLQNHGIHIIELEIDDLNVDGIATTINSSLPVIVVNTLKHTTTERKRFTALHELAHLLFRLCPLSAAEHEEYVGALPPLPYRVSLKHADIERLCNFFANAMLLPSQAVVRRIGQSRFELDMRELVGVREMYGISIAAIVHRLHDMRIIPDTLYHYFFEHIISPNLMEVGWGTFPIMEHADMPMLLKIRIEKENSPLKDEEQT
ncbi:MAG: XRE family transcriptional regulator [Bacteroidales bacterium]|nr:XRE family transcriptional regulator [Bacteroidales bacterium]